MKQISNLKPLMQVVII